MRTQYPLTREKASFCKFLVKMLGWSLTLVIDYATADSGDGFIEAAMKMSTKRMAAS